MSSYMYLDSTIVISTVRAVCGSRHNRLDWEAAGGSARALTIMNYSAFPLVRRDLRRYELACWRPPAASADLLREIRDGYESLDRVLVLDASRGRDGLNGVGNLFGDYIVWFAAAAAARRAIFLDWTRGLAHDRGGPCRRGECGKDRVSGKDVFDLSRFFSGAWPHADWAWNEATRDRVRRRHPSADGIQYLRWNTSTGTCSRLWRALASPDPLVIVEMPTPHERGAFTGFVPQCHADRTRSPADLTTAAEADLCDGADGLGACTLRALARRVATLNATRSSQSISRVEAERSLLVEYGVVRPSVPDDRPSARPPHSLFCPCSLHHRSRRAP